MRLAAPPGSRRESAQTIVPVAVFLVVVYGGLILVLWQIGIFDLGDETNAQVIAPVLALLGAAFGASLTLVGVMLKHSIDIRTFRLAQLEACIRGVDLFVMSDGTPAPPARQAGAMFALTQLGQVGFALALLREAWDRDEISPSAAIWVIDRGLESGDPQLEQDAAALLASQATRLVSSDGRWVLPAAIDSKWPVKLHLYARQLLLQALIRGLGAREPDEWDDEDINWLVLEFDLIRTREKKNHVGAGAVLALQLLLHSRHYPDGTADLLTAGGPVQIEASNVDGLVPRAYWTAARQSVEEVERLWPVWVVDGTPTPTEAFKARVASITASAEA